MSIIANIFWFIFIGLFSGLGWILAGVLCCVTIVGIPLGLQSFKMAGLTFCPFGKEVVYGGGAFSFLANVLWILFFGWELAVYYLVMGLLGVCLKYQCLVGLPVWLTTKYQCLGHFSLGVGGRP